MKILAIGDFHGKFPVSLQKKIKKINPDLIVSPGDFCGNEELIRLFFKYCYRKDTELWEIIGKKRVLNLERKNLSAGLKIIKKLNSFNIPIISVTGNYEPSGRKDVGRILSKNEFKDKDRFTKKIKKFKNFKVIDFKRVNFNLLDVIGYPRSSYPGKPKKKKDIKNNRLRKDNKTYFDILGRLFRKKDTILLSHNCPYRTNLDKFKKKGGEHNAKSAVNWHYGSYLLKQLIKKHQPLLCVCGHMHENQGIQKIGKTIVINTGPAYESKGALIELEGKKIKSIKFLR